MTYRRLFAIAGLLCCVSAGVAAESPMPGTQIELTNTGEPASLESTGHVLSFTPRAALPIDEAIAARQEAMAKTPTGAGGPVTGNSGRLVEVAFEGHVLTTEIDGVGGVLYAIADSDQPDFRAALSACLGMPVDYFDARFDTPDSRLLASYDAVFTWPETSYDDNVLFGDRLADFVDAGGTVILGQWCLPTQSFWLEGRIMGPGYVPVSARDDFREVIAYAGDGSDCVHTAVPFVSAYDTNFRDDCTLLGGNQSDGTYTDGFLSVAWRPDRKVYYSAGNTGDKYGTGDWVELVCNMLTCPRGGVLYAPSQPDNPTFRAEVSSLLSIPCDYYDARIGTPSLDLLSNYICVLTWVDFAYDNPTLFGNRLADYVDAGYGKVLLGQWCLDTGQPNALAGRILTATYCPVTAVGRTSGTYNGDGTRCVHDGVSAYDTLYLDHTVLRPNAYTDGTLNNGVDDWPSVSWYLSRNVYYTAGNTGGDIGATGDWAQLTANMCSCEADCGDPNAGSCCEANGSPACNDDECCSSVCAVDPSCCEIEWDDNCVALASQDLNCLDCVCADITVPPVAVLTDPPELGDGCACGDPIAVIGTASADLEEEENSRFESYTLEFREVGDTAWDLIAESDTPVVNGVLGNWPAPSQGYYVLRLTVRSGCGLIAVAADTVFVDGGYDTVRIDYPANNAIVGGNGICFDGTVFESWCGSTYTVDYRSDGGGDWLPVDPGQPTYNGTAVNETFAEWDTVSLGIPDGGYRVRVIAENGCGQVQTEIIALTLDNTPPLSQIIEPANCETIDGLVRIIGTAFDDNLARWTLQYTGGPTNQWVTLETGDTNVINDVLYNWDTSDLPNCAYTLRLVVTDSARLGCNITVHRTDYHTSVNIGGNPADLNGDGVVDLLDFALFMQYFTGPIP